MDSSNSNGGSDAGPSQTLNPQSLNLFGQGISLVLSRWITLQMAIENQWGGRDSLQKSHILASKILAWFSQSKEPLYIEDLENELDKRIAELLNTEIDDGSIEKAAEQLMVMYEKCPRMSVPGTNAVCQSKRVINDEDASDMMVDEPVVSKMAVEKPRPKPKEMADEDEWSFVAPRRNRGKKSG